MVSSQRQFLSKHIESRFGSAGPKHIGVPCNSCHPKSVFRLSNWASDCTPCHKNVHGESLFGQKHCTSCHSAKVEWSSIDFDHNHKTRFALEGPHKKPCVTCHAPTARSSPGKNCESCHKDVHAGRFAKVGEYDLENDSYQQTIDDVCCWLSFAVETVRAAIKAESKAIQD